MDRDESSLITTDPTMNALLAKIKSARGSGNQATEASLSLSLGTLYYDRGDLATSEQWYNFAEKLYGVLGDASNCATATAYLGIVFLRQGRRHMAEEKALSAFDELERSGNQFMLARVQAVLGAVYHARDELGAAEKRYRAAEQLYEVLGDLGNRALIQGSLGVLAYQQGNMHMAEEWSLAGLDELERCSNKSALATVQATLGAVHETRGDLVLAQERYRAAEELYRAVGDSANRALNQLNLGVLLYRQGHFHLAQEACLAALPHLESSGNHSALARLQATLGAICHARGELTAAEEHYRASQSLYELLGDTPSQALIQTNLEMLSRKQVTMEHVDATKGHIAFIVGNILTFVETEIAKNRLVKRFEPGICIRLPSRSETPAPEVTEYTVKRDSGVSEYPNIGKTMPPRGASVVMSSEASPEDLDLESNLLRRVQESEGSGPVVVLPKGDYIEPTKDLIKESRDWLMLPSTDPQAAGVHALHELLLSANERLLALHELAAIVISIDILSNIIKPGAIELRTSLYSLAKVAKAYSLPHRALRILPRHLTALPTPMIAHISSETFVTIREWRGSFVYYQSLGRAQTEKVSSFLERASGVALANAEGLDVGIEYELLSEFKCAFIWG